MNKKMYAILASYIILTVSMGEQALAFETDKIPTSTNVQVTNDILKKIYMILEKIFDFHKLFAKLMKILFFQNVFLTIRCSTGKPIKNASLTHVMFIYIYRK